MMEVRLPSLRGLGIHAGFTLIELLVVIAIIGLLSAIVLAALGQSKTKAQNARIQSDIHQYQTALELYFSKKNSYPIFSNFFIDNYACLGVYPGGQCWDVNSSVHREDTGSGGIDAALATVIPGPPPGQTVTAGSNSFVGYIYKCKSPSGPCTKYEILWPMNGESTPVDGASPLCAALQGTHTDHGSIKPGITECDVTVGS